MQFTTSHADVPPGDPDRHRAKYPRGVEPVHVWNPVGFDPRDHLPDGLHRHGDCGRYFLHRIHYGAVFDRRYRDAFVPLKAAYLRRFFPNDHVYKRTRDFLIASGAIACDGHYVEGEKAFGYKLGPELSKVRQHKIAIADPAL